MEYFISPSNSTNRHGISKPVSWYHTHIIKLKILGKMYCEYTNDRKEQMFRIVDTALLFISLKE